jgi:hypothetical protein
MNGPFLMKYHHMSRLGKITTLDEPEHVYDTMQCSYIKKFTVYVTFNLFTFIHI